MTAPDPELYCEPQDAVSQKAAAYFARRRDGDWGMADQAELDTWLRESTSHYVAWLRVERIFARANQLVSLDAVHTLKVDRDAPRNGGRNGFRKYMFPFLSAAVLALMAVAGVPLLNFLMQPSDHTFSTAIGDHTLLKFADGTEVELNSDSAIRYRMTTSGRTVWLEKGEAWFHVAHDAAHPFTVIVGRHRVSDLGTEFLVRRKTDGTEVLLVNGRAALSTDGAQAVRLEPGDDAIATPVSMQVTRKTPQQLADELAWRKGLLVFRNAPLAEVVRQFNRYNTTKLVIADPSIANVQVVANLRTDDYESFLQIAHDVLKLHVDREGGTIFISRGQPGAIKEIVHVKHDH